MTTVEQDELQELLAVSIGPACHELRGPLAAAYGFARMLENQDGLSDTVARYVAQVVRGCERLDERLDQLGGMGRVAAGRVHPTFEHVAVSEIVDEALGGEHAVEQVRVVGGDGVMVSTDREWIVQALRGLATDLRYDDSMHIDVTWSHSHARVIVLLQVTSDLPLPDVSPGAASLGVAHARMRIRAMGGTVDALDDGLELSLPRHGHGTDHGHDTGPDDA